MPEYRVYTLTAGNTIRGAPAVISCDTDEEAIEKARKLVDGRDVEVWLGARCVARIKAAGA